MIFSHFKELHLETGLEVSILAFYFFSSSGDKAGPSYGAASSLCIPRTPCPSLDSKNAIIRQADNKDRA